LWQPEAQPLSLLRRDIDRKPHKIKRVLIDERLRKAFFGGIDADEKKAVKAFANQFSNRSTALKRHPKVSGIFRFDDRHVKLLSMETLLLKMIRCAWPSHRSDQSSSAKRCKLEPKPRVEEQRCVNIQRGVKLP
jgi:hypothetical protein